MSDALSRRDFLVTSSLWGGGVWLALHLPRPEAARAAAESSRPEVLEADEWNTLEAITGRILPRDHEPGAIEAGCVNFIDKALAHEDAAALPVYRFGLAAIDAAAGQQFGAAFTALGPVQQDELLAALEAGSAPGWPAGPVPAPVFFETVRLHTILGFLADPRYGGNRGEVGWRVAGYPGPRHRHGGFSVEQLRGTAPVTAPGRSRP